MSVRAVAPTVTLRTRTTDRDPRISRDRLALIIGRVIFFALLLGIWQWATTATYLGTSISTPFDTIGAIIRLLVDGTFWRGVGLTILSTVTGLTLSIVLGITIGLVLSIGPNYYRSASFIIDFLRTVPGLAILPLGILVFGPTMRLDLLMILFSAIWPVIIQTVYAFRQLDQELLETVDTYRVPALRKFFTVLLPACMPRIVTGIRIAATMTLLLAIGTELLAGSPGLGNLIAVYQQNAVYPELYGCIILTGFLGIGFNSLIRWGERKTLAWHFTPRQMAATS